MRNHFFQSRPQIQFLDIANATIYFKCPLFVQLNLSKFGFTILTAQSNQDPEAYYPDVSEVRAPELADSEAIADDIKRTTDALLINPRAYQADGCDRFVSQVITPVNTYTELIVHGTLNQWIGYVSQEDAPTAIHAYLKACEAIIIAEWNGLKELSGDEEEKEESNQKAEKEKQEAET